MAHMNNEKANHSISVGKRLISTMGTEDIPIDLVIQESNFTEDQFHEYFPGKMEFIDFIFSDAWHRVNNTLSLAILESPTPKEAFLNSFDKITELLEEDATLRYMILHKSIEVDFFANQGFEEFNSLLRHLINRGKREGFFPYNYNQDVLTSFFRCALMSWSREYWYTQETHQQTTHSLQDVREFFETMLDSLSNYKG